MALQELVKSIFGDEAVRVQFLSDPHIVLARFSLTEPEKKAVMSTHAKMGLVTAGSMNLDATIDPTTMWYGPIP